jgi:SAM-dependent methyltransferase
MCLSMYDTNFNHRLMQRRTRATRRANPGAAFLHREAASILAERLSVTKRDFENRALLFNGPFASHIAEWLEADEKSSTSPFVSVPYIASTGGILALEPESTDLIVSVLDLEQAGNLQELLIQVLHALKPDGLFLAATLCGGSFRELRDALLQAESQISGGAAVRTGTFPDLQELGNLLQSSGFKLPVVDRENRVIRYGELSTMIGDLRDTGCTFNPREEIRPITSRLRAALASAYRDRHSDEDGKLRLTVEIGFISGWKAHESQQKPLAPGSGKNRLSDFL